jgi:hypothetical protein
MLNFKPPVSHYSAIDFSSFAYNKPQSHLLLYKLLSSNARRKTSGGRLNRADIARGEKKKDLVYGNKTTESQSAQRTTTPGGFSISIGIEKKEDESLFNSDRLHLRESSKLV